MEETLLLIENHPFHDLFTRINILLQELNRTEEYTIRFSEYLYFQKSMFLISLDERN